MARSIASLSFSCPVPAQGGFTPQGIAEPSLFPTSFAITEMMIGGKRYSIEAVVEDRHGNPLAYSAANYSPEAMQQIESYAHDLFNSHDLHYNRLNQRPVELIGANSQGLFLPDHSMVSHDFLIQPLSQEIAARIGGNNAARVKAQDVWNRLNNSLLTPQFRTPQRPGPQAPAPTQSAPPPNDASQPPSPPPPAAIDPILPPPQPNPQPLPPQPNPPRPRTVVQPTALQLQNHNFEAGNWYETIPLRTRLRISDNIHRIGKPKSHVEQRVRDRFQAIFDGKPPSSKAMSSVPYLLWQEHLKLKQECGVLPRTLPNATVEAAERFLKRLSQRASAAELRHLLEQIQVDDEFFRYLEEQVEAENLLAAEINRAEWARAHYREDISLFARVLERYLDNH